MDVLTMPPYWLKAVWVPEWSALWALAARRADASAAESPAAEERKRARVPAADRLCQASEIMNHSGRKGGPQGVQHGQNVDDFLGDGAAHRT